MIDQRTKPSWGILAQKVFKIRPTRFLCGRGWGGGGAEGPFTYSVALLKTELEVIKNLSSAITKLHLSETAKLAMKYPLLNIFQLRISL